MSRLPSAAFDARNLLTFTSLGCGVAALASASRGNGPLAGLAIAIAVIADTFDGRFARRFGADPDRRAIGTELDSLSDAIAFGIAPPLCAALLLHGTATGAVQAILWLATFVYAACAIARLASFNIGAHANDARGFIGIPVPLAALIWSTALLVQPSAAATTMLIVITAAAMVSPLRVPKPTGAGLIAFATWPLTVALLHAMRL